MKVGIISDIHCNVAGLECALGLLRDCDEIICAGDIMSQYRMSPPVLGILRDRQVHAILGNHDKMLLSSNGTGALSTQQLDPALSAYFSGLPSQLDLEFGGKRFLVFHGSPWDNPSDVVCQYIFPHEATRLAKARLEADFVILGHTHIPMAVQVGRPLVVNPGSCGEARGLNRQLSCAAIDLASGSVEMRPFPEV